ncbi:hypothetical protein M422DRAFT_265466 [Sphaerobolus stellatus SS14]|nr:hypothetical protein M422DRAFT_265466 [Sphaerobolus stellatus SS14]
MHDSIRFLCAPFIPSDGPIRHIRSLSKFHEADTEWFTYAIVYKLMYHDDNAPAHSDCISIWEDILEQGIQTPQVIANILLGCAVILGYRPTWLILVEFDKSNHDKIFFLEVWARLCDGQSTELLPAIFRLLSNIIKINPSLSQETREERKIPVKFCLDIIQRGHLDDSDEFLIVATHLLRTTVVREEETTDVQATQAMDRFADIWDPSEEHYRLSTADTSALIRFLKRLETNQNHMALGDALLLVGALSGHFEAGQANAFFAILLNALYIQYQPHTRRLACFAAWKNRSLLKELDEGLGQNFISALLKNIPNYDETYRDEFARFAQLIREGTESISWQFPFEGGNPQGIPNFLGLLPVEPKEIQLPHLNHNILDVLDLIFLLKSKLHQVTVSTPWAASAPVYKSGSLTPILNRAWIFVSKWVVDTFPVSQKDRMQDPLRFVDDYSSYLLKELVRTTRALVVTTTIDSGVIMELRAKIQETQAHLIIFVIASRCEEPTGDLMKLRFSTAMQFIAEDALMSLI